QEHATLLNEVQRIADHQQFFHWALHFPEVFQRKNPGFDLLLMNPPWERIKLQEKEWFAARSPEIADAPNAAVRKRMIAALEKNDPMLWQAFQETVRRAENNSHFIRNSGKYPLCGRGDVNTYAVFAELVRQIQAPNGRIGILLPSGIATDDTTKYYFQQLNERSALVSLYDFENRRAIFPSVHRSFKFCLLTLRGDQDHVQPPAEFVFFAHAVEDLQDAERRFTLSPEEIALLNPNTRTCPTFRSRRDAELTKSIYLRVPVLIREGPPEQNPWKIHFRQGLFNITSDSHLFRTQKELEAEGARLERNVYQARQPYLPLYEGRLGHQFNHRFATQPRGILTSVKLCELTDPEFCVEPEYFIHENDFTSRIEHRQLHCKTAFLGYRRVSRNTDER
ncbi:MAG: hypothetical protein ACKO9F_02010, partial [Caldilinea sp.]